MQAVCIANFKDEGAEQMEPIEWLDKSRHETLDQMIDAVDSEYRPELRNFMRNRRWEGYTSSEDEESLRNVAFR